MLKYNQNNILNQQSLAESIIGNDNENGNIKRGYNHHEKLKNRYLSTNQKKPCKHCGDTSGICGFDLPNSERFVCFSIPSVEAANKISEQEEYKVFNFNAEFGYGELIVAKPYKVGDYVIDFEDAKNQAIKQIKLLGFKPGDKIYIALLLPKHITIKKAKMLGMTYINNKGKDAPSTPMGYLSIPEDWNGEDDIPFFERRGKSSYEKEYKNGFEYLYDRNFQGYGIYLRPNQGGHYDEEITHCPTIFFECDRISKDEQRELIKQLEAQGIEVCAVVETLSSLHVYIKTEGLKPEVWKLLQERLIQLNDSDPSIRNPARLMRLAGFNHTKYIADKNAVNYFQCELISENWEAKEYSEKELNSFLPEWDSERWNKENNQTAKKNRDNYQTSERSETYSPIVGNAGEIPLFEMLPEKWQQIIKCGVDEGERNNTCLSLSTVVLGVLEGCQRRGINTVEKSPYDCHHFIIEFARNCSLDEDEAIGVFERAIKFNPDDSGYKEEFFQKKVKKYLWENNREEYKKHYGKSKSQEKTPEQLAKDNAQFATEKFLHEKSSKLNEESLKALGVKVTRINEQYLSPNHLKLEKGKISVIISAMGTRKTSAIAELKGDFTGMYSYHTRNTLAWATGGKLNLLHKEQAEKKGFANRVAFCANSADKFEPKHLKNNGLLLLDECNQLFAYLFESLCNKDSMRPRILAYLQAHIAAALTNGSVLMMSAHVSLKEIEYIKKCAPPNTQIEVIINEYKPQRGKVIYTTDVKPEALVSLILSNMKQGIPTFVIDDYKGGYRGCKTIAEYIRQELSKLGIDNSHNPDLVVEINSDTSETQDIKDYIVDINNRSMNTLLLVCSPSVISGISITNKRFNHVFGFINGILTPDNASQAISRARGAENLFIWCAEQGSNYELSRAITPEEVNDFYQKNYNARNKILTQYLTSLALEYDVMADEWKSHHWELFCRNAALKNLEMRRLRYWLKEQLINDGYQIEEKELGIAPNTEEAMKEIWAGLKLTEVHEIDDCVLIDDQKYSELLQKSNSGSALSKEEKLQVTKYHLWDTFGEEIIKDFKYTTPQKEELFGFAAIAYKNWGGGYEKALKRLYRNVYKPIDYLIQEDIAGELRQARMRSDYEGCNKRFAGDIKWYLRERKLFEFLNFKDFLDPNKTYYPDDYKNILETIRKHSEEIKRITGYNFEKVDNGTAIGLIYAMHGLATNPQQVTVNGKRIRVKNITRQSWELAQKFIKHQQAKAEEKANCTPPPNLLVNGYFEGGGVQALKTIPRNEYSHFEGESALQTLTIEKQPIDHPEYDQLSLIPDDWAKYPTLHDENQGLYNDLHDVYSYEDGD